MANTVAEFRVLGTGDIGGTSIARFHIETFTQSNFMVADANAAGAAIRGLFQAFAVAFPTGYTWQVQGDYEEFDHTTAAVQAKQSMSSVPAAVVGTVGTQFAAGIGARLAWLTSTVHGRRLIRGATFITPLTTGSFTTAGAVAPTFIAAAIAAQNAYVAALVAASLNPVVWHRPKPVGSATGVTGIVTGVNCGSQPGSLRSRRA